MDAQGNPEIGEYTFSCHRFPPSAFAVTQGNMIIPASAFPCVNETMFCSLFESVDVPGVLGGPLKLLPSNNGN